VTNSSNARIDVVLALPVAQQFYWDRGERVPIGASSWVAARWANLQFLIPEHRMIEYCNTLNGRPDRSMVQDDLRLGFLAKHITPGNSLPDGASNRAFAVPSEYQQYLLDAEVMVSTVAVEYAKPTMYRISGDQCYETSIITTIDDARKLKPGMVLYFVKFNGHTTGTIRRIDERGCHVVFFGTKVATELDPPIQRGDRLSSYCYW
jgi:hypothetical protein